MNRKTGMAASLVTLVAVLVFALSMIIGNEMLSYISSMFIAWGFVPLICAFASVGDKKSSASSYTAIAFAAVYAVFIMLVYFAQLTTVRLDALTEQAEQILKYQRFGLFFSYDLLGYAFMALATFFTALTVKGKSKADKALKILLAVHGIFAVSCVVMPILGIFNPGMTGTDTAGTADLMGVLILEFWCAFFTPVCILSYLHFKRHTT